MEVDAGGVVDASVVVGVAAGVGVVDSVAAGVVVDAFASFSHIHIRGPLQFASFHVPSSFISTQFSVPPELFGSPPAQLVYASSSYGVPSSQPQPCALRVRIRPRNNWQGSPLEQPLSPLWSMWNSEKALETGIPT